MMLKLVLAVTMAAALSGCASAPESMPATRTDSPAVTRPMIRPIGFKYPALKDYFVWPVKGDVISVFGAKSGRVINKGIDIATNAGAPVRASRTGRVVYCDPCMKGFGKTIILDHGDAFQTVYAFNSDILVKVGDSVQRNDVIARAGKTGRAKEPMLHFEIRRDGEPQNPYYYLQR